MLSVTAACAIAAIALAVAMGIGRFAFTPLLPLMVRDGSLAQSAGAWLAASNYLGYLAGALTASRLGLSAAGADAREPCRHRRGHGCHGRVRRMGCVGGSALRRGCAERLDARLDQRMGVEAPGAGWTHRSLRDGLRGRWIWHCRVPGCSVSWPRNPVCPPASFGWSSGRWQRSPLSFPASFWAGRSGASAHSRLDVDHRHACPVHRSRHLLRLARLRLHSAGHIPSGSRTRGGGRPAALWPCLAGLRHRGRPVHHRNGSAFRSRQSASRLGGQSSPHGHRGRPTQPVARPGDDRHCSAAGRQHLHGGDDDRHAGGPRAGAGQPHSAPGPDDRRVRHRPTGRTCRSPASSIFCREATALPSTMPCSSPLSDWR